MVSTLRVLLLTLNKAPSEDKWRGDWAGLEARKSEKGFAFLK